MVGHDIFQTDIIIDAIVKAHFGIVMGQVTVIAQGPAPSQGLAQPQVLAVVEAFELVSRLGPAAEAVKVAGHEVPVQGRRHELDGTVHFVMAANLTAHLGHEDRIVVAAVVTAGVDIGAAADVVKSRL